MQDLISRQAAIDALHMHLMYRMGTDSNKKRLDDWINGLPSAQPEQRWIPVSERMPEPRIDVWCNSDMGQMVGYYKENFIFGKEILKKSKKTYLQIISYGL